MQRIIGVILALTLLTPGTAWADAFYTMQVNGLACPFCAYGVEKKLSQVEGVKATYIDINNGRVEVRVTDTTHFTDEQMKKLLNAAGFTLQGMERQASVPKGWPPKK